MREWAPKPAIHPRHRPGTASGRRDRVRSRRPHRRADPVDRFFDEPVSQPARQFLAGGLVL